MLKKNKFTLMFICTILLCITLGISYSYFEKGISSSSQISSSVSLGSRNYFFSAKNNDSITPKLVKTDLSNGAYLENTIQVNMYLLSSNSSYECTFDVYYVWDDDRFVNDFTLNYLRPFELSATVYYADQIVGNEVDLGSSTLNSSTGKYETKIASSVPIKNGINNNLQDYFQVSIKSYNYSDQPQNNLVNNNKKGHIEVRNKVCNIVNIDNYLSVKILRNDQTSAYTVWNAINNIKNKATPNFANNPTTDEGMFAMDDNEGVSYYYRGAVTDNNVKFGKDKNGNDLYWKIVRINGDGTIRLLYNGHSTTATGSETSVGSTVYTNAYDSVKYVGYTYTSASGNNSYDLSILRPTASDNQSSTIKTVVDNWYVNTFDSSTYGVYLADSIYCNDRTIANYKINGYSFYAGKRVWSNKKPSLVCPEFQDKYTTNNIKGNKLLTYPVALLNEDEIAIAGNDEGATNTNFYLYTGSGYWTMTPSDYDFDSNMYVKCLDNTFQGYPVNWSEGVRPVINLKADTIWSSGNGTTSNPYQISL